MKKNIFKVLLLNILLATTIYTSNAQQGQISISELNGRVNTITSAVPFLMITPDSRAGGMGDLGVATNPDANRYGYSKPSQFFKLC